MLLPNINPRNPVKAAVELNTQMKVLNKLYDGLYEEHRLLMNSLNVEQARQYFTEIYPNSGENAQKSFERWFEKQHKRLNTENLPPNPQDTEFPLPVCVEK